MNAEDFAGTADLVLTNPYGPLPKGVIGKPCLISNFNHRKTQCEEWAQCELKEISHWSRGLKNTVWIGNDEVLPIDLTGLMEEEFKPGRGWFPLSLPFVLLKSYADPGMTVIDPFMGRGTVGWICKHLGLDFIGIDRDPERVEMAKAYIGC
jgi:DNA modification methylase